MKVIYGLLILVPVAIVFEVADIGSHSLVFVTSGLAMVPLAALLGEATDQVAFYTGQKIGGLLNATLGNAAELIITIIALREGLTDVVKASIAGSILGNILLVLGASLLFGGLKNGAQRFDAGSAGVNATMMALAIVVLVIPAVLSLGEPETRPTHRQIEELSDGMAVVMIILYGLYLLFTLRNGNVKTQETGETEEPEMKMPVAIGILAGATIAIVVMSEILVGALEPTAEAWGLSDFFVGILLVPLIGNIAEHLVAVQMAVKDKMDLSLGIAVGSGLQIATFVTPVLVLAGWAMGTPMTLVFNKYELMGLLAAMLIAVLISVDGKSNWLEGAELIALYVIIAFAFYFVP